MKIIFIGEKSDRPESHLIAGIARRGHQVSWIGPLPHTHQELLEQSGVTCYDCTPRSKLDLSSILQIRAIIKKITPDIVCSFTGKTISLANLAMTGFSSSIQHIAYRGAMGGVSRWDPTSYLTYRHPRIAAIMCVSHAVKEDLLSAGFSPSLLHTIYKGHAPQWYSATSREAVCAQFGIPIEHTIFAYVANMRDNKGVDVFLTAAAFIPADLPITFLYIGKGDSTAITNIFAQHPQAASKCIIAGPHSNPAALIAGCDIAAQLSKWKEGLPKTVIEAMIQGRPLISTPVGGAKELVVDEETGFFVPPEDPKATAQMLIRLHNDKALRTIAGEASRARILSHFRIEDTVERFASLMEQLHQRH